MKRLKKRASNPNLSIKALRGIIQKNQAEFAAMIGVSKETVKSWERKTNPSKLLTPAAIRIHVQTGADTGSLLKGDGMVKYATGEPYTPAHWLHHQKDFGLASREHAQKLFNQAQDSLWLLYMATAPPAVKPFNAARKTSKDKERAPIQPGGPLMAFHTTFLQWLGQAYIDFKLANKVETLLKERKRKKIYSMPYGQWRAPWAEGWREYYNFKDDPKKRDDEACTIEIDEWPCWVPGSNMNAPTASAGSQAPSAAK